jgi:hypothetical protein
MPSARQDLQTNPCVRMMSPASPLRAHDAAAEGGIDAQRLVAGHSLDALPPLAIEAIREQMPQTFDPLRR